MRLISPPLTQENGFTLIEALIAMVILTVGIFSLYAMQVISIQNNARASSITIASNWGAQQIEQILAIPYDNLLDTDGDGTNQDTNGDGLDNNGGDFGLNDITAASTPDGTDTSPDGHFSIFWNIAFDVPINGNKTVRVHVLDNSNINNNRMQNRVTIQYIKEGPI